MLVTSLMGAQYSNCGSGNRKNKLPLTVGCGD